RQEAGALGLARLRRLADDLQRVGGRVNADRAGLQAVDHADRRVEQRGLGVGRAVHARDDQVARLGHLAGGRTRLQRTGCGRQGVGGAGPHVEHVDLAAAATTGQGDGHAAAHHAEANHTDLQDIASYQACVSQYCVNDTIFPLRTRNTWATPVLSFLPVGLNTPSSCPSTTTNSSLFTKCSGTVARPGHSSPSRLNTFSFTSSRPLTGGPYG